MIQDIYFEKFPVDLGAQWQMTLVPPTHAKIKTSEAKVAISLSGLQAVHRFSTSSQPLSASQVSKIREIQREAKNRPFLFKNPFHNSVTYPPTITDFGTMVTGAFVLPAQSIFWQPVIVFASQSLASIALKPVVYVENAFASGSGVVTWDAVTKESNLGPISAQASSTTMQFASFDYYIPVRITQFEVDPIKNTRGLNMSCDPTEFTAAITLEEDTRCGLPIIHSWRRNDAVELV